MSKAVASKALEDATAVVMLLVALAGSTFPAQHESAEAEIHAAAHKIQSKEFAAAEELLQKALTEDSQSPVAYNLLGICQAQTGQYEAARKSFARACELDPKFVAARVNLGNVLLGLHKRDVAIEEFKAIRPFTPNWMVSPDELAAT